MKKKLFLTIVCILVFFFLQTSLIYAEDKSLQPTLVSKISAPTNQRILYSKFTEDENYLAILTVSEDSIKKNGYGGKYNFYDKFLHYIHYYNIHTGKIEKTVELGEIMLDQLRISNTLNYIAKYIADNVNKKDYVELYSLPGLELIKTFPIYEGYAHFDDDFPMKFSQDDAYLLFCSESLERQNYYIDYYDQINIYDIKEDKLITWKENFVKNDGKAITSFWLSLNNERLFYTYQENKINYKGEMINVKTLKKLFSLDLYQVEPKLMGIENVRVGLQNERVIITVYNRGRGSIYNVNTGELIGSIRGPIISGDSYGTIKDAILYDDGKKAVVSYGDKTIRNWDAITGKLISEIKDKIIYSDLFISKDNNTVFASYQIKGDDPSIISIIKLKEGKIKNKIELDNFYQIADMSKSNKYIAAINDFPIYGDEKWIYRYDLPIVKDVYIWNTENIVDWKDIPYSTYINKMKISDITLLEKDNNLLIPFRRICEELDFSVEWDELNKEVVLKMPGYFVKINTATKMMQVNGGLSIVNEDMFIKDGTMFITADLLSKILPDIDIEWQKDVKEFRVSTK